MSWSVLSSCFQGFCCTCFMFSLCSSPPSLSLNTFPPHLPCLSLIKPASSQYFQPIISSRSSHFPHLNFSTCLSSSHQFVIYLSFEFSSLSGCPVWFVCPAYTFFRKESCYDPACCLHYSLLGDKMFSFLVIPTASPKCENRVKQVSNCILCTWCLLKRIPTKHTCESQTELNWSSVYTAGLQHCSSVRRCFSFLCHSECICS